MLDHEGLKELYRGLRDHRVLSVYLDADQTDPAERNKWRVRLEHQIARCRKTLSGDEQALADFERAWAGLRERLEPFDAFLPDRGWVGFATADRVWYAESVPVPLLDAVHWHEGMWVAPYVRGLKHARPVVVLILDSRRARVFRFQGGEVHELQDCRADTFLGDLTDVNVSKRAATHTGVRGETGTDVARRVLDVSFGRMLKHVLGVTAELAGEQAFVALGGTSEATAVALQELPRSLQGRAVEVPSLYLEIGDAELRTTLDRAASEVSRRHQDALLAQVVDHAGGGGLASLGRDETLRALEEMRVDTLMLSRGFIREEPELAERCVAAALAQDAAVEELSEEGAAQLDRLGRGIGARLRYRLRSAVAGAPTGDGEPVEGAA